MLRAVPGRFDFELHLFQLRADIESVGVYVRKLVLDIARSEPRVYLEVADAFVRDDVVVNEAGDIANLDTFDS